MQVTKNFITSGDSTFCASAVIGYALEKLVQDRLRPYLKRVKLYLYIKGVGKVYVKTYVSSAELEQEMMLITEIIEMNNKSDAVVILSKSALSEEQYSRLKIQIDSCWPKDKQRPILLEGDLEIVKI